EPRVDELREAARGDREEDVLEHRGPAARHLVQRQGLGRGPQQARELRRAHGRQGLYREAGAAAVRLVPAGAQVVLIGAWPARIPSANENEAGWPWRT